MPEITTEEHVRFCAQGAERCAVLAELKKQIKSRKIRVADIAQQCGCSESNIYSILRGNWPYHQAGMYPEYFRKWFKMRFDLKEHPSMVVMVQFELTAEEREDASFLIGDAKNEDEITAEEATRLWAILPDSIAGGTVVCAKEDADWIRGKIKAWRERIDYLARRATVREVDRD